MREQIIQAIETVCKDLFNISLPVELTRPDEQFGDYSTNIALHLAPKLGKKPHEIAEAITAQLQSPDILEVTNAGPGFINIRLSDQALWKLAKTPPAQSLKGQTVVIEYSDPNPFKELHVGHLYDSIVGESLALLCESAGGKVHRVNFGGDVGLHVAKAMWGIIKELGGEDPEKLQAISPEERAVWLSVCYVEGARSYEEDEAVKEEIKSLNQAMYDIHSKNDRDSKLAKIYWTCRDWSYEYFNQFYERLGIKFDKYYPESSTAPLGLQTVNEQLKKGVFKKSEGAVVFDGEVHSLHTRVFINSRGLPTYEAKDIGLALAKWQDYEFDQNIILTGSDIIEYMKVVLAALKQFAPQIAERTKHVTHGMVKLQGTGKMSSRKGNVLRAVDIIAMTDDAAKAISKNNDEQTVLAAIKYDFLKQRLGGDIIYNPTESVSLHGNSGPYLQYTYVRANSIIKKSAAKGTAPSVLGAAERSLVRKISEFSEVVESATAELLPSHISTYLYELAQTFNRFYETNQVVGNAREAERLTLVQTYAETLKKGLSLLNIAVPEKM